MKKIILICLFIIATVAAKAQYYHGYAYAKIKKSDGSTRYINTLNSGSYSSEEEAKEHLLENINEDKEATEKFVGDPVYVIDEYFAKAGTTWGGTGWVSVRNSNGDIREINVEADIASKSNAAAKVHLWQKIWKQKAPDEEYVTNLVLLPTPN